MQHIIWVGKNLEAGILHEYIRPYGQNFALPFQSKKQNQEKLEKYFNMTQIFNFCAQQQIL